MQSNYKRLGDYIQIVNNRNTDLQITRLLGVSIKKVLMPSIANTIGTNMKTYKIIEKNQFAYGSVTSRNGDKISVALLENYDKAIVSQAYTVFKITDTTKLLPKYVMMWFRRPEFDRYARYKSHGSAREIFDWEELCDVELPIPSIEKQQEIVNEYHTVVNRIKLNEQLNTKLEETAQTLYKHWFVDFEFPCLPENYKFSETGKPTKVEVENYKLPGKQEDSEFSRRQEYSNILTYKRVGGLPAPKIGKWFTYVLLCENNSLYKGMTTDLYRRFYEHYTGKGATHTKTYKPIKVIHWQEHNTQQEARKEEERLKTGYGRTWLNRQIEKAGGIQQIISGLPAPKTELRTAGKMVYNEVLDKDIPVGWSVRELQSIANITSGKTLQNKGGTKYPVYGAGGVVGYSDDFLFEGNVLITGRVGTHGKVFIEYDKVWCTDNTLVFKSTYMYYNYFILMGLNYDELNKGGVQALLTQKDLKEYNILIPNFGIKAFEKEVKIFFITININKKQNQTLRELVSLLLARMGR